jgi:hypothetical protein
MLPEEQSVEIVPEGAVDGPPGLRVHVNSVRGYVVQPLMGDEQGHIISPQEHMAEDLSDEAVMLEELAVPIGTPGPVSFAEEGAAPEIDDGETHGTTIDPLLQRGLSADDTIPLGAEVGPLKGAVECVNGKGTGVVDSGQAVEVMHFPLMISPEQNGELTGAVAVGIVVGAVVVEVELTAFVVPGSITQGPVMLPPVQNGTIIGVGAPVPREPGLDIVPLPVGKGAVGVATQGVDILPPVQ